MGWSCHLQMLRHRSSRGRRGRCFYRYGDRGRAEEREDEGQEETDRGWMGEGMAAIYLVLRPRAGGADGTGQTRSQEMEAHRDRTAAGSSTGLWVGSPRHWQGVPTTRLAVKAEHGRKATPGRCPELSKWVSAKWVP